MQSGHMPAAGQLRLLHMAAAFEDQTLKDHCRPELRNCMVSKQVKRLARVKLLGNGFHHLMRIFADFVAILIDHRRGRKERQVKKHLLSTSYAPHQTPFRDHS